MNNEITAPSKKVACKSIESLLDIRVGQRQIALVCAYKPPSEDNNSLKNDLAKLLDEESSKLYVHWGPALQFTSSFG